MDHNFLRLENIYPMLFLILKSEELITFDKIELIWSD